MFKLHLKRLQLISRLLEGLIYARAGAEPPARSDKVKANGYHWRKEEAGFHVGGWDGEALRLHVFHRVEDLGAELLQI